MSMPIVTLRIAFPDSLSRQLTVTGTALTDMVRIWDSLNFPYDVYAMDPSIPEDAKQSAFECDQFGGYRLYVRTYDKDTGAPIYQKIENLDSLVPNSVTLFIHRSSDDSYVDIYSLYRLRTDKIFGHHDNVPFLQDPYAEIGMRVTAVLYSLNCRQKRLMESYIRDIDAVAAEQRLAQRVGDLVKAVQDTLNQLDSGIKDVENMHGATLPAEVWAYLVMRDLVTFANGDVAYSGLDRNAISGIVNGPTDGTGKRTAYGPVDSFKAWTQFGALLRHSELFLPDYTKEQYRVKLPVELENVAVADPYNSVYWYKSLETEENSFKGTIGIGDHWIFDPRLRDSEGHILNWGGSPWDGQSYSTTSKDGCAFFPGFGSDVARGTYDFVGGKVPEDQYHTFDRNIPKDQPAFWNNEKVNSADEPPTADFSVRWYGIDPPANAQDLENVMGEIFFQKYGGETFLPEGCLTVEDGQVSFSPFFKRFLECASVPAADDSSASASFSMTWRSSDSTGCFAVRTMEFSDSVSDSMQVSGSVTNSSFAGASDGTGGALPVYRFRDDILSGQGLTLVDYWPVPKITPAKDGFSCAYNDCVLQPIRAASTSVKLTTDKVTSLADALRMRSEQINGDSSIRTTRLQQVQQAAQQALAIAANLISAINKMRLGIGANLR